MKFAPVISALCFMSLLGIQSVHAQADEPDSLNPFKRKPATFALSAEFGMNSLSSVLGINATLLTVPRWAFDGGVGLSTNGLRTGLRARRFFSDAKLAPFAGLALKHGTGSTKYYAQKDVDDSNIKYGIKAEPATFTDVSVGIDYRALMGFNLVLNLGYSVSLTGNNWKYDPLGPKPSDNMKSLLDTVYGSGIMLSLAMGWAF